MARPLHGLALGKNAQWMYPLLQQRNANMHLITLSVCIYLCQFWHMLILANLSSYIALYLREDWELSSIRSKLWHIKCDCIYKLKPHLDQIKLPYIYIRVFSITMGWYWKCSWASIWQRVPNIHWHQTLMQPAINGLLVWLTVISASCIGLEKPMWMLIPCLWLTGPLLLLPLSKLFWICLNQCSWLD